MTIDTHVARKTGWQCILLAGPGVGIGAFATALLVMGEVEGKVFANENDLDVLMIIRKDNSDSGKFEFWSSPNFFQ